MPTPTAETIAANVANAIDTLTSTVSTSNSTLAGYVSDYTLTSLGMLNADQAFSINNSLYYNKSQTAPTLANTVKADLSTMATVNNEFATSFGTAPSFPLNADSSDDPLYVLKRFKLPEFSASDLDPLTGTPVLPSLGTTASIAPVWQEAYWTNLKNALEEMLRVTGASSVDTVITQLSSETQRGQVALYSADLERKQQALRDVLNAASAKTGARGFTYPNSLTTALHLDAQQKYQFDLSQTARDLIKYIMEWAKQSYQFTIQSRISAHQADIDFNIRYGQIVIETYATHCKTIMDSVRQSVEVLISQINGQVQAYNTQLDGLIKKYEKLLQTYREENALKLESASTEVKLVTARQEALKLEAAILESGDRLKIAQYAEEVRDYLGSAQAEIEANIKQAQSKIMAAEAMVKNAAAIASSSSQIAIGTLGTAAAA